MKNKPTSLRDLHVNKDDSEKRAYLSSLNDEYQFNFKDDDYDDDDITEKVKEKEFENNKIEADITDTISEVEDKDKTGDIPYQNEEQKDQKSQGFFSRLHKYWVRNYPELIIKEILVKIISTVIIGVLSFLGGFYLKGSISDKKIKATKEDFNNQVLQLKKDNASSTEKIMSDYFYNKESEMENIINKKIDDRLNIIDAINNINNN